MIFSQQTLYKTPNPENLLEGATIPEDYAPAEYRELVIKREADSDEAVSYVLYIFQGWWDQGGKEPKHNRPTIQVPYTSLKAAEDAYSVQLKTRIKQGYMYSFVPMPPSYPAEMRYQTLKDDDCEGSR
jgi:hypothetical protein